MGVKRFFFNSGVLQGVLKDELSKKDLPWRLLKPF